MFWAGKSNDSHNNTNQEMIEWEKREGLKKIWIERSWDVMKYGDDEWLKIYQWRLECELFVFWRLVDGEPEVENSQGISNSLKVQKKIKKWSYIWIGFYFERSVAIEEKKRLHYSGINSSSMHFRPMINCYLCNL